jgi:uncharacterized protein (TIGR03118 family)
MMFKLTIRSGFHRDARATLFRVAMSTTLLVFLLAGHVQAQEPGGRFTRVDLVSNVVGRAAFSDSRLVNPWGIANTPDGGPWWVVDEGKGRATVYSGGGVPLPGLSPLVVTIPVNPGGVYDDAAPTGIISNDGSDFELAPGVPARLIFVTSDGTIDGWNGDIDRTNAVPVVDNAPGAVYTGVTAAGPEGERALYVANFRQGRVEVYGTDFSPVLLSESAFVDPLIPDGYSPYNIRNINGELYVTFAEPRAGGRDAASGDGAGYVDIFDRAGNLVLRLQHGPWMNAPWALALAPAGYSRLGNHLLVGNAGSGRIAVFDLETGYYEGYVMDAEGSELTIPGIHGLNFGNGGLAGPENWLYFTAGREETGENIFGAIIPSSPSRQPALDRGLEVLP